MHEPATPLPWNYEQCNGTTPETYKGRPSFQPAYIYGGAKRICGFNNLPNDAAYIVHAANAYPKLADVCLELQELLDGDSDSDTPLKRAAHKLTRILRELGELE